MSVSNGWKIAGGLVGGVLTMFGARQLGKKVLPKYPDAKSGYSDLINKKNIPSNRDTSAILDLLTKVLMAKGVSITVKGNGGDNFDYMEYEVPWVVREIYQHALSGMWLGDIYRDESEIVFSLSFSVGTDNLEIFHTGTQWVYYSNNQQVGDGVALAMYQSMVKYIIDNNQPKGDK